MFVTLPILVLLILATPVTIIFDGPIIQGVVAAIAAVSLGAVALRIRPGEAGFLSSVIRPVAITSAVPAIWMLIQVIPMQDVGLANPVWKSAATALGHPLAESISIDPGMTFISLTRYLSAAAIAFVAAAVAIDRRRAGWVLLALTTATTLIALMVLMAKAGGFAFLSPKYDGQAGIAAVDGASLGIIFATAATLHMSEQRRTRQQNQEGSTVSIRLVSAACLVAFVICFVAVIVEATGETYYAVICGLATFAIATIIRRFGLGPWGTAAIVSVTLFVAIGAVALQSVSRTLDLTLAFASQAPNAADYGYAASFGRNELDWNRSRHVRRHPAYLSKHRRTDDNKGCTHGRGRDSCRNGPTDFLGNVAGDDRTRRDPYAWCTAAPKGFILFDGRSGLHCDYRVAVVRQFGFVNYADFDSRRSGDWHGNRPKQEPCGLINIAYAFVISAPPIKRYFILL